MDWGSDGWGVLVDGGVLKNDVYFCTIIFMAAILDFKMATLEIYRYSLHFKFS